MDRLELLERIIDAFPLNVYAKDAEFRHVVWNQAVVDETDIDRDTALGATDFDLFDHDTATYFRSKDVECFAGREPLYVPATLAGDGRWAWTWKIPLLDESGRPTHLVAIHQDVTDMVAVQKKAAALDRNLRRIIENLDVGFFLLTSDGTILDGFTDSCRTLLGDRVAKGARLTDILGLSAADAGAFQLAVEQAFDDLMPEVVSRSLLTGDHLVGESTTVTITPTMVRSETGDPELLLFSVRDTTTLVAEAAANRHNQALLHILSNGDAFRRFVATVSHNLATARHQPERDRRTILHTLKGNLAQFGVASVAGLIHRIEDAPCITDAHLDQIAGSFAAFLDDNRKVLGDLVEGDDADPVHQIPESRLQQLEAIIGSAASVDEVRTQVGRWLTRTRWRPASTILRPLANGAARVAQRLEKEVTVEMAGADVLVDLDHARPVVDRLDHLVRNAVVHGIEHGYERVDKAPIGTVRLTCADHPTHWELAVEDDGRGIDPDRLARIAVERGVITDGELASMTELDQLELIYRPGFSTTAEATEVSGRGVGLTALADAVADMGGTIDVATTPRSGTRFTVTVPKPAATRSAPQAG